ncbi:MAG: hypothetical protein ACRC1P_09985 [Cellulosilyticaceae bacterium]
MTNKELNLNVVELQNGATIDGGELKMNISFSIGGKHYKGIFNTKLSDNWNVTDIEPIGEGWFDDYLYDTLDDLELKVAKYIVGIFTKDGSEGLTRKKFGIPKELMRLVNKGKVKLFMMQKGIFVDEVIIEEDKDLNTCVLRITTVNQTN